MNSILESCVSDTHLDGVTADELSAVSGGHNSMLSYLGTGVSFNHNGLVVMRNGEVILQLKDGKVVPPK